MKNILLMLLLFSGSLFSQINDTYVPTIDNGGITAPIEFKVSGPWEVGVDTGIWVYNPDQLQGKDVANGYKNQIINLGWNDSNATDTVTQSFDFVGFSIKYNVGDWDTPLFPHYTEHYLGLGYRYYDMGKDEIIGTGDFSGGQTFKIDDIRTGYINTYYIFDEDNTPITSKFSLLLRIELGIKEAFVNQVVTINNTGQLFDYNNETYNAYAYHALEQFGFKFTPNKRLSIELLFGLQESDFKNWTTQSVNSNYSNDFVGENLKDAAGNPLFISLSGAQFNLNISYIW